MIKKEQEVWPPARFFIVLAYSCANTHDVVRVWASLAASPADRV